MPSTQAIVFLSLLALCTRATAHEPAQHRRLVPGVGVALATDYVTASIHLPSTTDFNVHITLDPSDGYKRFMRGECDLSPSLLRSRHCPLLAAHAAPLLDAVPLAGSLCSNDRLPACDTEAVANMIGALQGAVRGRLNTTACFADVAVPASLPATHHGAIRAALASRRLQPALPGFVDAARAAAAAANGVQSEGERVLLVVDCSGSGLAATLFAQELGVLEELRRGAWSALGADAAEGDERHWEKVAGALGGFVQRNGESARVDDLVTYGDRAAEQGLRDALRKALDMEGCKAEKRVYEPLYASAAGVARASFNARSDSQFSRKPFRRCAQQSTLYGAPSGGEL